MGLRGAHGCDTAGYTLSHLQISAMSHGANKHVAHIEPAPLLVDVPKGGEPRAPHATSQPRCFVGSCALLWVLG